MQNKPTFLFFFVLVLLMSLGQVTSDLYLPSLPAIAESLHTTNGMSQLTVSLYMFGFSFSQLFYGPLSDGYGRRGLLIIGMSLCVFAAMICAYSTNIHMLILGRFLQGLGAGSGLSLSRSILRDTCQGKTLAKYGSLLAIANVAVLASAPLLGGYIQYYLHWRANFIFLLIYSVITLAFVLFSLEETNSHRNKANLKIQTIKKNMLTLLTHRDFLSYSICIFFTYGAILAWVTAGPVILQVTLDLTPIQFGWIALGAGLCFVIGGYANSHLVFRFNMATMTRLGISIMLFSGLLMMVMSFFHIISTLSIIIPVYFAIFSASLVFPNAFAGAFNPFPKIAGITGALFGSLQILGGALSSLTMSYLPDYTQLPLAIVFSFCAFCSLIALSFLKTN